jgi:hypothetical protein
MTLPPLAPGKIPAFHTLGDDVFEDLCRELIQEEDDVQAAERYGTRGQRLVALAAKISKARLTDDERDALSSSVLDACSCVVLYPEQLANWRGLACFRPRFTCLSPRESRAEYSRRGSSSHRGPRNPVPTIRRSTPASLKHRPVHSAAPRLRRNRSRFPRDRCLRFLHVAGRAVPARPPA